MKKSLRKNKRALLAVLVTALLIIGITAAARSHGPGAANLGTVKRADLEQRVTIAGTIIPRKRTVIIPPYNGYIQHLYVKVGDTVKMGAPIVSVVQSLNAEHDVYPIRAPFPGSVVQVLKSEGEYVEERGDNNMLVRIDDMDQLFVIADAPEIDMVKIKVGQEVVVKASAVLTRSYKGVVREISLAAREKKDWNRSNEKVEFPIRIEITDKDAQLKPGMSTLIDIIAARREKVLTLRHEFVQRAGDKYFAVLENGKRRDIEVGLQNEELFEVAKGLDDGERVRQTDFLALPTQENLD